MNLNMISAIMIPVGACVVSVGAAFLITVLHFCDVRRNQANEWARQNDDKRKQLRMEAGNRVVNSVNSNNNDPRLSEDLSGFFEHLDKLGIDLHVDLRGCAENGGR